MSEPLLAVQGLHFHYPDYPNLIAGELFRDLNLTLHPRERCLVLGQPESGKTTLSRLLMGLVPRYSGGTLKGSILLEGRDLKEHAPCDLLEDIGLAFQNPEEQLIRSRCDSEVAFGLEALGMPRTRMRVQVREALKQAGLAAHRARSPATLSGGEKKKLLLACLMALDPALWILDETLEELDIAAKKEVLELLRGERKTCLVFSSKWHRLYAHYFTSCCLLEGGRLHRFEGPLGGAAFTAWLRKHGLELPRKRSGEGAGPAAPAGEASLLQVRALTFRYPGGSGFSLEVNELSLDAGETVALIGANGSGKSTLGKLLCGLLKAEGGEIKIRSKGHWLAADPALLNRFCGYMFQNPDYQIFLPEVREELAYGLKQGRRKGTGRAGPAGPAEPAGNIPRRVEEAIDLFGLPGPKAPPSLMSYGARKRLQAAVYYLLERHLLIVDEGDSGISAADFRDVVRKLSSPRRALLIITHDLELASLLADRILAIQDGRLHTVEAGRGTERLEALIGEGR
jgi:energy-coupling factor transporter ATP-binding protein EcfA2